MVTVPTGAWLLFAEHTQTKSMRLRRAYIERFSPLSDLLPRAEYLKAPGLVNRPTGSQEGIG